MCRMGLGILVCVGPHSQGKTVRKVSKYYNSDCVGHTYHHYVYCGELRMGSHVQWNLSNVVTCGTSCTGGTCLMWPPVGLHVQWNLSNVVTCGTSCTVEPV